jgi:hypothetical protein
MIREASAPVQTVSRHLPLRMRRLRILLPSFVLLRAMKPCRLFRRSFLGWYVRFGKGASSGPKKKMVAGRAAASP